MTRGARLKLTAFAALACLLALAAAPSPTGAQGEADAGTVSVDVRVWQDVRDPLRIFISARPEGSRWDAFGTPRLHLDDGFSGDGAYRFGVVAVGDFEVRVSQHTRIASSFFVDARPVGGEWDEARARRLRLDDGRSSDGNYRYGDITLDVPRAAPLVEVSPGGNEVPRLAALTFAFRTPPPETGGATLVSIEPPTEGAFAWLDERTLLFQPDYPGWQRGQQYRVVVHAAAAGLDADHVHTFAAEGRLEVASVIPGDGDTEIPLNAQVLVQFNRSVAPLTVLQEGTAPPVLQFDPPLEGRGEWLNTSLYRFIPADLEPSTTYSVRIPAGLTSATDGVLESDYAWSFTTIQPSVTSIEPHDRASFVEPDTRVRVTFSAPMDRASVEEGLTLRPAGGEAAPVAFAWSDDSTVVSLKPEPPLELSTRYEVVAPAGLRGAGGGATRTERSSSFTTVDPPRVEYTSPGHGETNAWCCGVYITYNNPMDAESFSGRISINGSIVEDGHFYASTRSVNMWGALEYSTEYTISIAEGVRDRGGRLAPAYEFSFTTRDPDPPRPALGLVGGEFALWPARDAPILRYRAQRLAEVHFRLYRLTDAEAEILLRRNFIDGWDYQSNYIEFLPDGDPLREWTETIPEDRRDEWNGFSTSPGDGETLPVGHFLVTADAEGYAATEKVVLSVIDTTIVTKLANDELLVWALDWETGEPLAGVEVLAGSAGEPPYTAPRAATTDEDGLARFAVSSRGASYWGPYGHYLARVADGGRNGVTLTWWDSGSSPWALDVPTASSFPTTRGHLYTDRPIYRPGETVYYKGVVRSEDDASYMLPGAGTEVRVSIRDANYDEFATATVTLTELGTFSAELTLPDDAPTGTYLVDLAAATGRHITSTRFTVAEFRVPEFEVEVEIEDSDYVSGESMATEARATFFFGGPVKDAPLSWTAQSIPTAIRVEGYEDYSFSHLDYWSYWYAWPELRSQGESRTDAEGIARFEVPARLGAAEGTHEFTVSATVTDQNAQAIAASATVTVHPATWYAGIKPDSYIATAGEPETIHLVTVDYRRTIAPERPVTVRIYKRTWERGEHVDTEVEVQSVTTGANGEAAIEFTPPSSGTYRLVAESTDDQGRIARSSRFLWVSGFDYAPWFIRDDNIIELVADRDSYEVGDVAEVLVPAPFANAVGLVTVERGRVLHADVRDFETNSEVLRIPIEAGYLPNVYVGVVLYRPPTENDPQPRYRIGYVNLSISTAPVELDVRIEPDRERAAPGETVRYEVRVTDMDGQGVEADVSVAIVDKAVLSLAADVGPDGLGAFWEERPLGVRTAWSREVVGGGGGEVMEAEEAAMADEADMDDVAAPEVGDSGFSPRAEPERAPRVRGDFQNTALWLGELTTDAQGRASFELALPDNATTWRARARAVTAGTQVGEGESELLVTQPLLVRPALPRFLRVGDEVQLRTLVRNGTDEPRDITVAIAAEGVVLDDDGVQTQRIEPGRSALFAWPARAPADGTAAVRFTATTTGYGDAVELSFPVYLDVTRETTATGGVVEDAPVLEAVYLPEYVLTGSGSLELSLQASLVGLLEEEFWHIEPYFWWESHVRIASRIVAGVAVQRANPDGLSEGREAQLRADIATLVDRQLGDGGWAWCRYCWRTDMWVTGWVLVALGEARDAGYDVPAIHYDRTMRLIEGFVGRQTDVERPPNLNQHAFLLYALTSAANQGGVVSPLAREQSARLRTMVEEQRTQLTSWGRAYLVLALLASGHEPDHKAVRTLLNDLTATTIPSANGNHWEDERRPGSMHNTSVRATALVLRALVEAAPRHALIEETVRWLVLARSQDRWKTSVEQAQGMASLGAFAELTGENRGVYDYRVLVNTTRVLEGHFDVPAGDYRDAATVALEDLPLGEVSRVQFDREAVEGRMYYALNLRYLTPAKDIEALNRGFAVSRRYTLLDEPSTPVTSAALGDVVRVTVTVVAPADRLFARVEDFLPAGLEPIDPVLEVVPAWLRVQLQQDQAAAVRAGAPSYCAYWFYWCPSPWDEVDLRDDRVTLLATSLPRGVYEYVYFARATAPGDFFVAPVHAEETYFPDVFGRGDSSRFTVHGGE